MTYNVFGWTLNPTQSNPIYGGLMKCGLSCVKCLVHVSL